MFDVGWTEMLVIAIVMIVVVGPKDLPRMLRTFGKATSKMRSMAGEFRKQFDEALKEAELEDVKTLASDMRKLNPAADIRKALNPMEKAAADLKAGKAQFVDGNYGLAEQHFRKAVELRADNAEAWMGLAAAYDELGRFDFADRAYDQLVKLAGRRPEIVNHMGYSQHLRGNDREARKLLMEARAGMADKAVVDANLAMLKKG